MTAKSPGSPNHCGNLSTFNVSQSSANADLVSGEHPLESGKPCPSTGIIGLIPRIITTSVAQANRFLTTAVNLLGVSPGKERSPTRSKWRPVFPASTDASHWTTPLPGCYDCTWLKRFQPAQRTGHAGQVNSGPTALGEENSSGGAGSRSLSP